MQQSDQQRRSTTNRSPSPTYPTTRRRTAQILVHRTTCKLRLNSSNHIRRSHTKEKFPQTSESHPLHKPSRMRPINSIMPITRRILIPVPIPIPPRHKMSLHPPKPPTLPPPITILNPAPRPLVRNLVLAPAEVVSHSGVSSRPRDGRVVRIEFAVPSCPVGFRPCFCLSPVFLSGAFLLADHSDVDVGSFVCEDVEEPPATWPAGWVAGSRIFRPDPSQSWWLSHDVCLD